jgi:predicted nucleotidyltransferase
VVHGSTLFGTSDAESDVDVKSVWLPSPRDILLGRTDWTVFEGDQSRRNAPGDLDHEQHDIIRYLKLVASGCSRRTSPTRKSRTRSGES